MNEGKCWKSWKSKLLTHDQHPNCVIITRDKDKIYSFQHLKNALGLRKASYECDWRKHLQLKVSGSRWRQGHCWWCTSSWVWQMAGRTSCSIESSAEAVFFAASFPGQTKRIMKLEVGFKTTTPACYLITVVEVHLLGLMKLNKPEIRRSLYRPMRKLISSELLKSEQSIMFLLCTKKIILWLNFQPPFITLACTDGGSFCACLGWREQFVFVSYHLFRCFFFFIYLCFLFYLLRVCVIYFPFLLIGRFFLPLILLDL